MKPVLTLNSDLMPIILPIYTLPAQQAVNRIVARSCYVLHSFDAAIKTANPDQLDVYNLRNWPSIIARHTYLKRQDSVSVSARNLYYRDEGRCRYCGTHLQQADATIDHYVPKAHFGDSSWTNIVLACGKCNSAKGDDLPVGRWKLAVKPHAPSSYEIVAKKVNFPLTVYDKAWLEFLPTWKGEIKVIE